MTPKSAEFASDEFGDAYWRELASIESLGRRHEVHFVLLSPTRADADALADRIRAIGAKAEVSDYCGAEQRPWQVAVKVSLPPSTLAIGEFHAQLSQLAQARNSQVLDSGIAEPTQTAGPLI